MTKNIGIVSVSYEGTALCYRSICEQAAVVTGEYHHPQITMHSFPLADYMRFLSPLNWEGFAELLLTSVEKVARAGADFAICPANTAHEAFEFMRQRSPIPWLHIVEAVADAAVSQGCSKLGILGTRFLMEGKVYREVLENRGIEAVIPEAAERERINTFIFEELVKGTLKSSTREYFRDVASKLTSAGCDGVVMACTEIPLILFFPNETTTICQGFTSQTGIPVERPGRTVSPAATLGCDTNGDGTAEATIVLTSVTPVNCNLVRATIPVSASFGPTSTSAFPATCCGGPSTIIITTTFSAGDNNVFFPNTAGFTRTTTCSLLLGTRAPVVISVTPSSGPCGRLQDVLITGACFTFTQFVPGANPPGSANIIGTVTSVFAVDVANPANRINAQDFTIINANLLDAHFNFGSANAGKTFVIFVTGPGGTSRGLVTPVTGQPAGCALGNEQGCLQCITFTCNAAGTPGTGGTPEIATVTSCKLDRQDTGQFFLDVTGTGIKEGATATVGGVTPKKIKVVEVQPGSTNPTKLRLVKKVCNGLPGAVIITNPGSNGGPSQPFNCTERCPAQ